MLVIDLVGVRGKSFALLNDPKNTNNYIIHLLDPDLNPNKTKVYSTIFGYDGDFKC